MASTFSALPSAGEISTYPAENYKLQWRISNFTSLMKKDKIYFSPTFFFNGTTWRMCIDVDLIHLNAGIIRASSIPSMCLEVSVGFKTVNGMKDGKGYAEVARNGCEAYISFNCLQKTELLKRMWDLLPSNVLTVMCTLRLQKSEDAIQKCGVVWPTTHAAYRCRTCAVASSMCLCSDCFQRNRHEGHDFNMFLSSAGSFCDCGDKSFLMESGFCQAHGSRSQINKNGAPPDLSYITEVLMPRFFLRLEQHLRDSSESDESCASAPSNIRHENKVLNDLKELFLKEEDCDVLINVKGKEFHAHKVILKARSPVLASTFRNDMKEKSTGVLDIEDCDPSSFSDFLCFLYCGDIKIISQANVFSLFMMADKYDVQDLRAQCMKFMKENLCVDTFCDIISIALRHSEKELIEKTTDFFIKNAPKIIVTRKWQSFLDENPTESNELFVKLLVPNSSNLNR